MPTDAIAHSILSGRGLPVRNVRPRGATRISRPPLATKIVRMSLAPVDVPWRPPGDTPGDAFLRGLRRPSDNISPPTRPGRGPADRGGGRVGGGRSGPGG